MRGLHWISELDPRLRAVLLALLFLLLVLVFYPFQTIIVPDWHLKVLDQSGAPVREINVTEHWQHYLLENSGHEELRRTAEDGTVNFPRRTIRAGLLRRLLATVGRIAREGTQGKREPYASVVVWGSRNHTPSVAVYDQEQAPLSEIVVHSFR